MREDLRRTGGGVSAEVTACSNGIASGHGNWVAASSTVGSAERSSTGDITQGGSTEGRCTEAEMASGMSGREGGGWDVVPGSSSSSDSCL